MNTDKYYIELTGRPLFGCRQDEAASALGRLLKMPEQRTLEMLQGRPSRIKKELDRDKALLLKRKIADCGVGCDIEPVNREPDPLLQGSGHTVAGDTSREALSEGGMDSAPSELPQQESPSERLSLDELAPDEPPSEQLTFDQHPPDDTPSDRLSLDDLSQSEPPPEGLTLDQLSLEEPSHAGPEPEQAGAMEVSCVSLSLVELPPEEPAADDSPPQEQSSAGSPLLAQAGVVDAPFGGLALQESPPEEPSVDEPLEPLPTQGREASHEGEGAATQQPFSGRDDDEKNPGQIYEQPVRLTGRGEAEQPLATSSLGRRKQLIAGVSAALLLAGGWVGFEAFTAWSAAPASLGPAKAEQASRPLDPQLEQTHQRMEKLARSVKIWMIQYGSGFDPAQVTMTRIELDLQIPAADMLDGWQTPFRYQVDKGRYAIVSAGPDRAFGTGDDLSREKPVL